MKGLETVDILGIGKWIGETVGGIGKTIDALSTSDAEKLSLKNELKRLENELEIKLAETHSKDLIADATGETWIQKTWRPLIMLTFTVLVVLNAFGFVTDYSARMWDVIEYGICGTIGARSVEKGLKIWRK